MVTERTLLYPVLIFLHGSVLRQIVSFYHIFA